MKTRIHKLTAAIAFAAASLLLTPSVKADILGPYTPDASTTHLFHMDEASNPPVDSGASPITMAAVAAQPGSLGHAAFSGFGTSGRTNRPCCGHTTGVNSDERGWINTGGNFSNTALFGSTSGAFTIETLVNFSQTGDGDFTQIMRGYTNSTTTTSWNIRLLDTDAFEVVLPNGDTFSTPVQSISDDTWYHLAVSFDGNSGAGSDAKVYFTEMDAGNTEATLIHTFNSTSTMAYNSQNFDIGSRHAGQMNGFLDEIRFSSVARAADDMMFGSAAVVPEPSSLVLFVMLGLVGLTLALRGNHKRR